MFQEHLKSCGYCQNIYRATKLAELGHMIKGTHMQGQKEKEVRALLALLALLIIIISAGGVNNYSRKPGYLEKTFKLKELGKLVRG